MVQVCFRQTKRYIYIYTDAQNKLQYHSSQ